MTSSTPTTTPSEREQKCKHPSRRLYSWTARDALGTDLYVGCCDCGESWMMPRKHKARRLIVGGSK